MASVRSARSLMSSTAATRSVWSVGSSITSGAPLASTWPPIDDGHALGGRVERDLVVTVESFPHRAPVEAGVLRAAQQRHLGRITDGVAVGCDVGVVAQHRNPP
jgi:hypothetical protein